MKAFDANEPRDVKLGASETCDEVLRLRRTVRDLVALSALPSIWVDCDLERSLENLMDVLRATLRALTVCVRLELPDGSRYETAASGKLSHGGPRTFHAAELLDELPSDSNELVSIPRFNGTGPINALPHPVFAAGRRIGNLVACFREDFFPEENERLILQVAANQIMLLLQRDKAQEERFARKLAEDRLRQAEHHYQQLVQSLPAAVYTCDNEGRITLYNETAVKLWGRRPKIGEDMWCGSWKIFNTDGKPLPLDECPMAVAIREGRSVRGQEIIVERPDGTRAWVLPHPDPIRNEAGQIVGAVNMLVQVDELKRVEQALRASEGRLQSLLNLMPAAVYACDADGRITFYNPRAAELWGREPRLNDDNQKFCAAYRCWFNGNVLSPEDTPMAIAVGEGKSFRNLEPAFERPDGTKLSVLVNIDPLFDSNGNPAGAINVFQDITPLKRAEEAVRTSEATLRSFYESSPLLMGVVELPDDDSDIVHIYDSPATERFFNLERGSSVGRTGRELGVPSDVLSVWIQQYRASQRDGKSAYFDYEHTTKSGKVWLSCVVSTIGRATSGRMRFSYVVEDVTGRKRVADALQESQRRLSTLISNLPGMVYRCPTEAPWPLTFVSEGVSALCGWTAEEFTEGRVDWFGVMHPEDRDSVGREVEAAIREHRIFSIAYRIIHRSGDVRWVLDRGQPIYNEDGLPVAFEGFAGDLTEQKRFEEALQESKALLESQKDAFQAAMRGSSLEESLEVLVRRVIEFTGGRARAAFYIANRDGTGLHHIIGMPEHYAKAVDNFPISAESMACGLAVHTGQPEIAVDVEQEPKWETYRWLARHHNFRACWSFPVRTKDSIANGTLAMYFQEPCAPTPREMEMAAVIAHAATVIISRHQQSAERERAEEAMRKRGERLQLLSETLGQLISARDPETIVRELFPKVAAHLGVDTYFNFMVDQSSDALMLHSCAGILEETARQIGHLEFGQAICGTVAQTREGIHATDIQHSGYDKAQLVRGFGIQCYACNPLLVGDRLLGTLSFASRTRIAFDEDELQFLRIISQYTAVALDQLQGAERLKESEERFRAVLDNSTTVIYLKDLDGRYLLTNHRHAELFHLPKNRALGKTDEEIFPPAQGAKFRENDLTVLQQGQALEFEEVAPHDDGPHTYISVKFPLRKADGTIYAVAGISTDITERRKVEDALRRSEKLFRELADSMPQMIWAAQPDGHVDYYNKRWYEYTGFPERYGDESWTPVLHPDDVDRTVQTYSECIRDERIYQIEYRLKDRETGSYRWFLGRALPIRDESGKVIRWFGTCTDIDDQKREEEKLEAVVAERTAQLRDTVAELEAFSYSVAHDMRAPLRAMNSYSRFLQEDFAQALPPEAREFTQRIANGAQRLDALITDVLNYSKIARGEMTREKVDVEKLIRDIVESYPNLRESGAAILVQSGMPMVTANTAALTQCISNLLSNAVKFVAPGTTPRVLVRAESRGESVRLWFEDNGIGISEEGQQRIFRMFQRLNPAGDFEGTGIGLTIVRKAIERMGGKVGVESKLGSGSQFWIELNHAT